MLALYAAAPAQPVLANPVRGVGNSRARGSWLKATSNARLRLLDSYKEGCSTEGCLSLELHLNEDVLISCPLQNRLLSMKLLPSSSTGGNNLLLITPKQQSKVRY